MLYNFYDFETNGLPFFKEPSGDTKQPHIVQIAAKLVDGDTRRVLQSIDITIKPEDWEITQELTDIHGISHGFAQMNGVSEKLGVAMFMGLQNCKAKPIRVAYNKMFDERMMRIALHRFYSEEVADQFREENANALCAMKQAKQFLDVKHVKLVEAYQQIMGHPMSDKYQAHSAMGDVDAMIDIFWAMQDGRKAA